MSRSSLLVLEAELARLLHFDPDASWEALLEWLVAVAEAVWPGDGGATFRAPPAAFPTFALLVTRALLCIRKICNSIIDHSYFQCTFSEKSIEQHPFVHLSHLARWRKLHRPRVIAPGEISDIIDAVVNEIKPSFIIRWLLTVVVPDAAWGSDWPVIIKRQQSSGKSKLPMLLQLSWNTSWFAYCLRKKSAIGLNCTFGSFYTTTRRNVRTCSMFLQCNAVETKLYADVKLRHYFFGIRLLLQYNNKQMSQPGTKMWYSLWIIAKYRVLNTVSPAGRHAHGRADREWRKDVKFIARGFVNVAQINLRLKWEV